MGQEDWEVQGEELGWAAGEQSPSGPSCCVFPSQPRTQRAPDIPLCLDES